MQIAGVLACFLLVKLVDAARVARSRAGLKRCAGMSFLPHRKRWSRRGFLGTAALSAGAAWCRADEGQPSWIDAHVHVWTSDTVAYPLAEGFAKSEMQPPGFTPDELLAQCRA